MSPPLVITICLFALTSYVPASFAQKDVTKIRIAGDTIDEASGMAASSRHRGVLWIINDGRGGSVLHAVGTDGAIRGEVSIGGIKTRDAEALAAFTWRGAPHLLVADVGDNKSRAGAYTLHAIPEPDLDSKSARPNWSLRFRYEDGSHNCESVAVDSTRGEILIVTKGKSARLHILPLRPQADIAIAKNSGPVAGVDPAGLSLTAALRRMATGGVFTGLDLSPDGDTAALLTYSHINLYRRADGDSWTDAFAAPPEILTYPNLIQAEALAFSPDGTEIWVASEKLPAEMVRIPLTKP